MENKRNIGIAIHGGAGTILRSKMTPERETNYRNALKEALEVGYACLQQGQTAIDAVEAAVILLEDCPLFNAGKGSVFNAEGKQEMDASIMEGKELEAGAVAAIQGIKNPIKLARKIMEESAHILLIGEGASQFAQSHQLDFEAPKYFYNAYRYEQWQRLYGKEKAQLDHSEEETKPEEDEKYGTVGAVALDQFGNLAAATSTGGMTNKKFGRVGDSPIIGVGTYANNATCAISCTGSGEYFMRAVTAYDVSCLMEYKGLSLQAAAEEAIMNRLSQIGGSGGLIGMDAQGNIVMPFNCAGMYRGFQREKEQVVEIFKSHRSH